MLRFRRARVREREKEGDALQLWGPRWSIRQETRERAVVVCRMPCGVFESQHHGFPADTLCYLCSYALKIVVVLQHLLRYPSASFIHSDSFFRSSEQSSKRCFRLAMFGIVIISMCVCARVAFVLDAMGSGVLLLTSCFAAIIFPSLVPDICLNASRH